MAKEKKKKAIKLTPTQVELLEAMKKGVKCYYMPYMGSFNPSAYYFRDDTKKRCTAAAKALLRAELVVVTDANFRGHILVIKKESGEEHGKQ